MFTNPTIFESSFCGDFHVVVFFMVHICNNSAIIAVPLNFLSLFKNVFESSSSARQGLLLLCQQSFDLFTKKMPLSLSHSFLADTRLICTITVGTHVLNIQILMYTLKTNIFPNLYLQLLILPLDFLSNYAVYISAFAFMVRCQNAFYQVQSVH